MIIEKLHFIQHTFPTMLKNLQGNEYGEWGKMNAQQMVEHLSDSIRIADEKNKQIIVTSPEQLEVYRNFMLSEKPFKPNTKNALMGENPPNIRQSNMADSVNELNAEIADFIAFFKNKPEIKTTNPFFGMMNFEEWVHLLHKHFNHHAKQFRLIQ